MDIAGEIDTSSWIAAEKGKKKAVLEVKMLLDDESRSVRTIDIVWMIVLHYYLSSSKPIL